MIKNVCLLGGFLTLENNDSLANTERHSCFDFANWALVL